MREDYAVRATAHGGTLRAFAARTTELVKELQRRHHTWPVATAALGRAVTVGAMMGLMLKGRGTASPSRSRGTAPSARSWWMRIPGDTFGGTWTTRRWISP